MELVERNRIHLRQNVIVAVVCEVLCLFVFGGSVFVSVTKLVSVNNYLSSVEIFLTLILNAVLLLFVIKLVPLCCLLSSMIDLSTVNPS